MRTAPSPSVGISVSMLAMSSRYTLVMPEMRTSVSDGFLYAALPSGHALSLCSQSLRLAP